MKLLDGRQIKQKIKRLAIEILEQNFGEKEIILAVTQWSLGLLNFFILYYLTSYTCVMESRVFRVRV